MRWSRAPRSLEDADRGIQLTLSTNNEGQYVASPLRTGRYSVTVEKQGFKKSVAGPVQVNIQDRVGVDLKLEPGMATEVVTVTGQRPQLETETSELGQVVDSRRINALPLNGRNYAQLALLGTGVAPAEPGSRVETTFGFSAGEARSLQNNFLLDGIDNNANLGDVLNGAAYVVQPAVDAIAEFDDSVARGGRGLKVLKELGLGVRDSTGKLIPIDDPRLDAAWEECGRLGIPAFIHVADPEAFVHPIDARNERYEELIEHPDWSFYGPQFPSMQELFAQRDRMFAKHPHTTFVALHFGSWPENLDFVEQTLQNFPNVMIETGAREGELGRQPRRTREIFMKYSDRIMFGTDEGAGAGSRPETNTLPTHNIRCKGAG